MCRCSLCGCWHCLELLTLHCLSWRCHVFSRFFLTKATHSKEVAPTGILNHTKTRTVPMIPSTFSPASYPLIFGMTKWDVARFRYDKMGHTSISVFRHYPTNDAMLWCYHICRKSLGQFSRGKWDPNFKKQMFVLTITDKKKPPLLATKGHIKATQGKKNKSCSLLGIEPPQPWIWRPARCHRTTETYYKILGKTFVWKITATDTCYLWYF